MSVGTPWKPVRRSPVHQPLVAKGAILAEVAGWLLAEHLGDAEEEARTVRSGVGLADLSFLPKWEIKGSDLARFLADHFGSAVPEPGRLVRTRFGTLCRVSRNHALLLLKEAETPTPPQLAEPDLLQGCVHATDRTSGLANLLLCGPETRSVLRKVTPLDLRPVQFPDLSCAAGPLANVQVFVFRRDRVGLPAFEILFSREYGEYLWQAIQEAGEEYHLRPFGWAAARRLEQ